MNKIKLFFKERISFILLFIIGYLIGIKWGLISELMFLCGYVYSSLDDLLKDYIKYRN